MIGDAKDVAVSTAKERVIELEADAHDIVVPVSSDDKIILNFPIAGVTPRTEGNALVLECPGGQCVYLPGAMESSGTIVLADGRTLSVDELLDLLMQNQEEEPAAGAAQEAAMLSASEQESAAQNNAGKQPDSADSDSQDNNGILSGGGHAYQDGAGGLLGSIDRFGHLGRIFWSSSHEGERTAFGLHDEGFSRQTSTYPPHDNVNPTPPPHHDDETKPLFMDVSLSTGPQHLSEYMVLESDPDGAFIRMELNTAPETALPLVLAISGTALMGVDYAAPSQWLVLMADGSEVPGLITDLGNGQVSFNIPAGSMMMGFRVPVIANGSVDPDRTFTYTVLKSGGYMVRSGQTGTVTIVDDAHAQEHGWTPPPPGDTAYSDPHQAGPKTAYARIVLTDGTDVKIGADGQPLRSSEIMENSAGDVHYRFQLLNAADKQDYTLREANLFTVKLTGAHGLALGSDYDFDFTNIGLIDPNYSYNPVTGILTFTLPQGWSGAIDFTGHPNADFAIENGAPRENIAVEITNITPLAGTEIIIHGPDVATDIIDIPTAYVAANVSEIFESAGRAGMPNSVDFTFKLTSAVPQATTVQLNWEHLDAGLNTGDYTYTINGMTYGPNQALPASITFPAGSTSVVIKVTAYDDKLTENLERLKVTILPEDTATDNVSDNYHVADGTNGLNNNATVSIIDDADPARGGNGAYNDGPLAQLILTDASGTPLSNAAATTIMENGGKVYYQVQLVDRVTRAEYHADQDVTVNLKTVGLDGALLNGADADYGFTLPNLPGFSYNPATGDLSVVITQGDSHVRFTGESVSDSLLENREQVRLDITSTESNETSIDAAHKTATVNIMDIPTVSVAVDHAQIFESASHPTLPNEATFTFSLNASVPQSTTVNLNWEHLDAELTSTDYKFIINGTTYGPGAALPATITFPANTSAVTVKVIAVDDKLAESLERLKVTITPENGSTYQPGDSYAVTDGTDGLANNATVGIIDDTDATHGNSGAYLDGPLVQLILTDINGTALSNSAATSIMENGGKVYYRVQLVDRVSGLSYNADQDVTVTLKAQGVTAAAILNGAGTDYGFTVPGGGGYSYDPVTGNISLIIPAGSNHHDFTGTAVGDNRVEGAEQVKVDITSVTGNEASIDAAHKTATATIVDVPAVSVSVDHQYIYESDALNSLGQGGAALGNEATFTFTLNSPSLDAITVPLDWATGTSTGMTTGDYTYTITINGVSTTYGPNQALPASITFPAGQTSLTIKVIAYDDAHSEGDETLRVTLKPQSGASYDPAHKYYVTQESGKSSAAATIKDDTVETNPALRHLDGPELALYVVNNGTAVDTRQASVWEETPVKTAQGGYPAGLITYRVQLLDHNGNTYTATRTAGEDDIYVTLTLTGISTATYGSAAGTGDYYLDTSLFASGVFQSFTPSGDGKGGVLVLKIAAGSSYVDLPVKVVADNLTETKRFNYTEETDGTITKTPIEDEGFKIEITGTQGNESSICENKSIVDTNVLEEFINTQVCIERDHEGAVMEGDTAKFKVYLTQPTDEDVTVFVRVSSNNPQDLESRLFEVVIPKGQREAALNVKIFNDTFSEGVKGYELEILDVRGGEAIINENRKTATGLMNDDMNGPVVSITGMDLDNKVYESADYPNGGGGHATYKITLADSTKTPDDTHVPSEDMIITLKLEGITASVSGADADVKFALTQAGFNFSDPRVSLEKINADGTVEIRVKGGQDGFDGDYFTFTVDIVDDSLSENNEAYKISIIKVEGSEATIDSGKSSVTTSIIDDTQLPASEQAQYLDGPFVHLTGEVVVSESCGVAKYTLTLRDANGNIVDASKVLQDVVVTLKYTNGPGGAGVDALDSSIANYPYGAAQSGKDYTELPTNTTVTIKAFTNKATFEVPIADDGLSEFNERYTVEIDKVSGNEARIPTDADKTTVTTTIIDSTDYRYEGGYDPKGDYIDHADGERLSGPIVSMMGTTSVSEDEGEARYQIKLSAAGEEDMTITLHFKGNGTASPADVDLAQLMTYTGVTNVRVDPGDPTSFTFDVLVKKGEVSFDLRLPIINDDLTEIDESFTLSLIKATGAEGQILPSTDPRASQYPTAVTTEILDDGSGPHASISVDAKPGADISWSSQGNFKTDDPDFMGDAGVHYRVHLDKPAAEEVTVYIRLFTASNPSQNLDRGVVSGATYDAGTGLYAVKIPAGSTDAVFTLPKNSGQYFMEIKETRMSESSIDVDKNLVETKIYTPGGGEGPSNATYIRLVDADRDPANPNVTAKVAEGNNAHYQLQISKVANYQEKDGVTATFLINPKSSGLNFADFDFSDPAKFASSTVGNVTTGTGTGIYSNLAYSYNSSTGVITVTVHIPNPQPSLVDFYLPIKADGISEVQETFTIIASSTTGGEVYFTGPTSYDKHLVDTLANPLLTLTQDGDPSSAKEGSTVTYTLTLDSNAETDITVELKFGPSGSNPALGNADYVPYVLPVTIPAGSNTATFTVTLPNNEYWQGNQTFEVWVDKVTKGQVTLGTGAAPGDPLETVIYEDNNGPKASFPITDMQYGEDEGDVTLYVTFDRPAVEQSWATIKVTGGTGAVYGEDFTLAGIDQLPAGVQAQLGAGAEVLKTILFGLPNGLYYYKDGNDYYILARMPQGEVKATINIPGFLIDNDLTGGGKAVEFELVKIQGGEVSIISGSEKTELEIIDVIGGPFVNVTGSAATLHENPARTNPGDLTSNTITYTFNLTGANAADHSVDTGVAYNAQQPVTITYHFESTSGHPLPSGVPAGSQTIAIPAGSSSKTLDITILDDYHARNNNGFKLVIDSVSGNEARKGSASASSVSIVEDDHAPVAGADSVFFLVPPTPAANLTFEFNVLANDTDADGDTLKIALPGGQASFPYTVQGVYGWYTVYENGKVVYTLDSSKEAVSKLTSGQIIPENRLDFTVTDGYNPVSSQMTLTIKAGAAIDGDANAQTIIGSAGNDTIDGKGGADIIHGMAGNDTLIDVDGKAILYGDEGNDTFVVKDVKNTGTIEPKNFSEIHGGAGVDTIQVSGTGKTLDMRENAWTGAKVIDSIEILDIAGGNNLYLDSFGVNKLNASRPAGDETPDHPLRIIGAAGSTFEFPNTGEGWHCADPTAIVTDDKGRAFYVFEDSANNTVLVQTTLTQIIHGTSGDDAFTAQDRLIAYYGLGGDDVIHVGSGKNTLYGEAGSDTFILGDGKSGVTFDKDSFAKIDGGAGTDTLRLSGTNNTLDLTGIIASKLTGIEVIDISGSGGNSIVLDAALLANDTGREGDGSLTIKGNTGDYYELKGTGWTYTGVSNGYSVYTNGAQTLKVQADMVRVQSTSGGTLTNEQTSDYLKGGAGNDTFALKDLTADGKITGNDFGKIAGGGGADKLTIAAGAANDNLGIDLTGLAAGKISGISVIDLAAHGANHLKLDNASLTQMGATTLTVNGDASDTYELAGTGWVYQSTSGGYHQYADASGKILKVQTGLVRIQNADAGGSTLTGDVATEKLLGGAGNDTFALKDVSGDNKISGADFGSINGGGGSNTLAFAATANGLNIDLTALGANKITNVSTIDLTGHGNNRLILDNATIVDMGLTTLTVNGEPGDTYELTGAGWVYSNTAGGYHIYTNGAQNLHVQDTLTRVQQAPAVGGALTGELATDQLLGGAGDDIFALKDLTGDNVLSKADFGLINGGAGANALAFASVAGNDLGIDLTALGAGKISGISVIDLTGHGNNRLTLDAASLSDMNASSLTVKGENGDTYELTGSGWSYSSTSGGYHTYTNSGRTLRVQDTLARVQQAPAVGGTLTNILATDQLLGGPGNDIFALVDISGNGKLSGDDFGLINGNAGSNTLNFASGSQHDNLDMDFTALSAGKISGVSAINLTGHGSNHLDLDGDSIRNMGIGDLHVNGDSGDTFTLNGAGWTYTNTASGYHEYTDVNGKSLYVAEDMSRVVQAGDSGETLTVEHGNTMLMGGAGDDILEATATGSGQHYLHGGAGDDTLRVGDTMGGDSIVNSADFSGLHGGAGSNTLEVGAGLTFDLTSFTPGQMDGIQHVVLGANSILKLDAASLHSILDDGVSNNLTLLLDGDASSTWDKGAAAWNDNGATTINSVAYTDYSIEHDSVTLHVLLKSGVGMA